MAYRMRFGRILAACKKFNIFALQYLPNLPRAFRAAPTLPTLKDIAMKKLLVTINAELHIPDAWELVDHEDGIKVLDTGEGEFIDFDILPMVAASLEEGAIWSSASQALDNEVVDMVRAMETSLKLQLN